VSDTTPEITVRDALEYELDEIAQLLASAYAEFGPNRTHRGERVAAAWREYQNDIVDVRTRWRDGSTLIVAESAGQVAGAVTYYPPGKADEAWPRSWATFRLLGVDPARRREGIGRSLTIECIRRAREGGAPVLGLHTTDLMAIAKGMYERMGFERLPELGFYPAPELAVIAYRLTFRKV